MKWKWIFAVICFLVVCDLAMDDPVGLRHPDFNQMRQSVRNFAYHLSRGEYGEMLKAEVHKR